jgi:hypothetical protein
MISCVLHGKLQLNCMKIFKRSELKYVSKITIHQCLKHADVWEPEINTDTVYVEFIFGIIIAI